MVFILIEPVYAKSVWCVNLLEGLTSELRGKRIIFKMVESLEGIEEERSFVWK